MMTTVTLVVAAIVAALCIQYSWAVQYEVGGSQGWDLTTDLNTWVSGKKFKVGDTLVFKYTGSHSVDEVNKAGYDACSAANAMSSSADGNTVVKLSTVGKRYFVCGTAGHCSGGMKLEIDTLAALATVPVAAPAPAPAPSPTKKALSPAPARASLSPAPARAALSPAPARASLSPAPAVATIPASATPSDSATAPSTTKTPVSKIAPVASPPTQNGATGNGVSGFAPVALAGAAMAAFLML